MGSAQRVLNADEHEHTSIGIDLVEQIAASFGLRAYQLLVPGLDPATPAPLPEAEDERRIARVVAVAMEFANSLKQGE